MYAEQLAKNAPMLTAVKRAIAKGLPVLAECRVHVHPVHRQPYPQGSIVRQNHPHVGWLTQDAHVRHDTVIYKVMCSDAVAPVFLPDKFLPRLRLLNFSHDRRD